jgi:hypothetical protein
MSKVGSKVPTSYDMARELLNVKFNHLDICTLEKTYVADPEHAVVMAKPMRNNNNNNSNSRNKEEGLPER